MPQLLTNDCYLLMACVILSVLLFGLFYMSMDHWLELPVSVWT